jgi:hypothetical protein
MKKIASTLIVLFILGISSSYAQSPKSNEVSSKTVKSCCSKTTAGKKADCNGQKVVETEVTAYYFHATRRCATCEAVEKVTSEILKETYGDKVSFKSINREEDKDNPLIEKYKINAQTLIIVKGDEMVDLTTNAFLNARSNPEKLEKKIKTTVDKMLK